MAILGVPAVDVHKCLIQSHATKLPELAMDVLTDQDVIDRHWRQSAAAIKIERLPSHVFGVGRTADGSIMPTAALGAVNVHRHAKYFADVLDQLQKLGRGFA